MTRWCDLRRGDVLVRKLPGIHCVIYILDDAIKCRPDNGEGTPAVKLLDNEVDHRPIRNDVCEIGSSWDLYFASK